MKDIREIDIHIDDGFPKDFNVTLLFSFPLSVTSGRTSLQIKHLTNYLFSQVMR